MINPNSYIPLYHQLAQILKEQIQDQSLSQGQMIPSERELMKQYKVSRNTVRQALDQLVREGLIFREHGHGTFVSNISNTFHYMLDTFFENRDLLIRAGYTPSVDFLATEIVIPLEPVQKALQIPATEKTLRHTMIFYADQKPAMFTQDFLPMQMAGDYDLSIGGEGFIPYLDRAAGMRVEYVLVDILAVPATAEINKALNNNEGNPLLLMQETFMDASQTHPICFSMNYFNQEVINFRLLTKRG